MTHHRPQINTERHRGHAKESAELRHVAVLFADLQGFTYLCERLDSEEVVDILHVIYDRLGQEVERYGGYIDKVLGDGLMVLFGAPQAHENDGLRAVMAGLAMQRAIAELQPWIRERLGQALAMRVGIDAGPVVYGEVGPGAETTPTVIGDAANVAARLQRMAGAGQVVISERARRLASRQVQFRRLGTLQLEGRRAAVEAFVAVAPYASLNSGPPAMATALAGRSSELEQLMALYNRAASGKTTVVLITGEGGIGKSRLLAEFVALLDALGTRQRPRIVKVHNRWEVGDFYRPYDELVGQLGPGDSPAGRAADRGDSRSAGNGRRVETSGGAAEVASRIASACRAGPCLLAFDDWEWADEEEGQRLAALIESLGDLPVLLVIAGRRVELPLGPEAAECSLIRLRLAPLSVRDSWALLQQHPACGALPPEVGHSLLRRTGGNPSHILESVDFLVDQGIIAPSGDGWRVVEGRGGAALPETLRNDVLSRLDSLDADERQVLRVCAVVGRPVSVSLAARILEVEEMKVREALQVLVDVGLMVPADSAEEPYGFRSELVKEVTYDSMLKRQRRELHRLVGEVLEGMGEAADSELALHFIRARASDKAVPYGLRATSGMLARDQGEEALRLLLEMDGLIEGDDLETRATYLERLGQAYVATGKCSDGTDRLVQALALVRDPHRRGCLLAEIGWAYAIQSKAELAMKHYQRANGILASCNGRKEMVAIGAAMRLLYDRP